MVRFEAWEYGILIGPYKMSGLGCGWIDEFNSQRRLRVQNQSKSVDLDEYTIVSNSKLV